jgi:hypothetical protein
MGTKIFEHVKNVVPDCVTGVFVEIGSDRHEGSTEFFAELAQQRSTKLISVDISSEAKNRLSGDLPQVEFVINSGSDWAKQFAQTSTPVSLLYLDNFDYMYEACNIANQPRLKEQINFYASQGIVMNNQNCQVEHLSQLLHLQNLFTDDVVVVFDDTYRLNDCWVGKCGACVTYLLTQNYKILHTTTDCGIIMSKNH